MIKPVCFLEMVSDLRSAIAEIARHFHHDVSDVRIMRRFTNLFYV